jgi:hypothetical protein
MSGLVTGIVLDRYPHGGGERLVAVALADNAHRDGTRIFPSIAEVAERTKLSRRTVQLHIARMVASGWLILTKKSTGRRGDTNEYRISPEWLAGGECLPPAEPVLRTNAKRSWGAISAPHENGPWGADIAPHEGPAWGATGDIMGCNLTHHGVQPIAPKPSLTVIEPIPPYPPEGVARVQEPPADTGAQGFENVWSAYPRKVDQDSARGEWERLAPDADLRREMLAAIARWTVDEAWRRENGRYIPKLAKWLRQKRWTDVPGTAAPPPAVATVPPPRRYSAEELKRNRQLADEAVARLRPTKKKPSEEALTP